MNFPTTRHENSILLGRREKITIEINHLCDLSAFAVK